MRKIGIGGAVGIGGSKPKRKKKQQPSVQPQRKTAVVPISPSRSVRVRYALARATASVPDRPVFGWDELDRRDSFGDGYAKLIAAWKEATRSDTNPYGESLPTSVAADLSESGVLSELSVAEMTEFFRLALAGINNPNLRIEALQEGRTTSPVAIDPIALLVWKPKSAREFVAGPGQLSVQPMVVKPGMEGPVVTREGYVTPQHEDMVDWLQRRVIGYSGKRTAFYRSLGPDSVEPVIVHDARREAQFAATGTYQLLLPQLYGYRNLAEKQRLRGTMRARYASVVADLMESLKTRASEMARGLSGQEKNEMLALARDIVPNGVWSGRSAQASSKVYAQLMTMRNLVLGTIYRPLEGTGFSKDALNVGREARMALKSLGLPITRAQVENGLGDFWSDLENDHGALRQLMVGMWVMGRPPGESRRMAMVNYVRHFGEDWSTPQALAVWQQYNAIRQKSMLDDLAKSLKTPFTYLYEGDKKIKGPISAAIDAARRVDDLARTIANSEVGRAVRAASRHIDEAAGSILAEPAEIIADAISNAPKPHEYDEKFRPSTVVPKAVSVPVRTVKGIWDAYNTLIDKSSRGWARLAIAEAEFEGLQEQARGSIASDIGPMRAGEAWRRKENIVSRTWAGSFLAFPLSALEALVSDEFDLYRQAWKEAVELNAQPGWQTVGDMALRSINVNPVEHPNLKIATDVGYSLVFDIAFGKGLGAAMRGIRSTNAARAMVKAVPWMDDAASAVVKLGTVRNIRRVFRIDSWEDATLLAKLARDYNNAKRVGDTKAAMKRLQEQKAALSSERGSVMADIRKQRRAAAKKGAEAPKVDEALRTRLSELDAQLGDINAQISAIESRIQRTARKVTVVEKGGRAEVVEGSLADIEGEISALEAVGRRLAAKADRARRMRGRFTVDDARNLARVNDRLEDLRERRAAFQSGRLYEALATKTPTPDDVLVHIREILERNLVDSGRYFSTMPLRLRLRTALGADHPFLRLATTHIPRRRPHDPIYEGEEYLVRVGRILGRSESEIDTAIERLGDTITGNAHRGPVGQTQAAANFIVNTERRWQSEMRYLAGTSKPNEFYRAFTEFRRSIREGAESFMLGRAYLPRLVRATDEQGRQLPGGLIEQSLVPVADADSWHQRRWIEATRRRAELEEKLNQLAASLAADHDLVATAARTEELITKEIERLERLLARIPKVGKPLWEREEFSQRFAAMWTKRLYRLPVRNEDGTLVEFNDIALRSLRHTTKGGVRAPVINLDELHLLEAKLSYLLRKGGLSEKTAATVSRDLSLVRAAIDDATVTGALVGSRHLSDRLLASIYEELLSGRFAALTGSKEGFRILHSDPHRVVADMLAYCLRAYKELGEQLATLGVGASTSLLRRYARYELRERMLIAASEKLAKTDRPMSVSLLRDTMKRQIEAMKDDLRSRGLVRYEEREVPVFDAFGRPTGKTEMRPVETEFMVTDPVGMAPNERVWTSVDDAEIALGLEWLVGQSYGDETGQALLSRILRGDPQVEEMLSPLRPSVSRPESVGGRRVDFTRQRELAINELLGSRIDQTIRERLEQAIEQAVREADEKARQAGAEPILSPLKVTRSLTLDQTHASASELIEAAERAVRAFTSSKGWSRVEDFEWLVERHLALYRELTKAGPVPQYLRRPLVSLNAAIRKNEPALVRESLEKVEAAMERFLRERSGFRLTQSSVLPDSLRRSRHFATDSPQDRKKLIAALAEKKGPLKGLVTEHSLSVWKVGQNNGIRTRLYGRNREVASDLEVRLARRPSIEEVPDDIKKEWLAKNLDEWQGVMEAGDAVEFFADRIIDYHLARTIEKGKLGGLYGKLSRAKTKTERDAIQAEIDELEAARKVVNDLSMSDFHGRRVSDPGLDDVRKAWRTMQRSYSRGIKQRPRTLVTESHETTRAIRRAQQRLRQISSREKAQIAKNERLRAKIERTRSKLDAKLAEQQRYTDELKRARDDLKGYIEYLSGQRRVNGRSIYDDVADAVTPHRIVGLARNYLRRSREQVPRNSYEALTKARSLAEARAASLRQELIDVDQQVRAAEREIAELTPKVASYKEEINELRGVVQSARKAIEASQQGRAVPFWTYQLQSWVYPAEDYELLAIYQMGKAAQMVEKLYRKKWLLGLSPDDFTRAYKNLILAKLSTMIRIVSGDEGLRLFTTEGVNPLRVPYYRRRFREISGGMSRSEIAKAERRIDELGKAIRKQAKEGDVGTGLEMMQELAELSDKLERVSLSPIPRGFDLHEISELLDQAQSSSHMVFQMVDVDGNLNPSWMQIYPGFVAMLREEPMIQAYARLVHPRGRKARPVVDDRQLRAALREAMETAVMKNFLSRTMRTEEGLVDEYIDQFISLMREWEDLPIGRHVIHGEAIDPTDFKPMLGDPDLAEKMPLMIGRVKWRPGSRHFIGRMARGETMLHRALYGALDALSTEVKQILFAARFEEAVTALSIARPLAGRQTIERLAAMRAARAVDEAMYTADPLIIEQLLRNVSLFLPAYRQFWVYWAKQSLQNPAVLPAILHVNELPDQLVIDSETPIIGKAVGLVESLIEAAGGPEEMVSNMRLRINPRSVIFLTGGSSGRDESLIVQQMPGFGPLFTVPLSMMQRLAPQYFYGIDRLPGLSFARYNQVANSAFDNIIYGITSGIDTVLGTGLADAWSSIPLLAKTREDRQKVLINIARAQYQRYLDRIGRDPELALRLDPPTIEQVRAEAGSVSLLNGLVQFFSVASVTAEDADVARHMESERAIIEVRNALDELGYDEITGIDGLPENAREKAKELLAIEKETLRKDPFYALVQRYFDSDVDEQDRMLEKHPEITPYVVSSRTTTIDNDIPLTRGEFFRQWLQPRELKDPQDFIDDVYMRINKDDDRELARELGDIIAKRDEEFEKLCRRNGIKPGSSRYIEWRREFEQGVGDFAGRGLLDVNVPIEKLPSVWREPYAGSKTVNISTMFSSPQELLDIIAKDRFDLARQRPGVGEATMQLAGHIFRLPGGQRFMEQTNVFPDFIRSRYEQRAKRIKELVEMSKMRKYWFTAKDWADLGFDVSDKVIAAQDKLNLIYEEYERRRGNRAWNSREGLAARQWMIAEQAKVINSDPEVKRILGMGVAERLLRSNIGLTEPLIATPGTWMVERDKKGELGPIHKVTMAEWRQFLRARKEWEAGFDGTIKEFRDRWAKTLSPAMLANLDEVIRAWSWKVYLQAATKARNTLARAYNPYTKSTGYSPYSKYGRQVKAWLDGISKQLLGQQPFRGREFVGRGENPGFADEWDAYNAMGDLNTRLIDWTY